LNLARKHPLRLLLPTPAALVEVQLIVVVVAVGLVVGTKEVKMAREH
jgi:hypothetical protein